MTPFESVGVGRTWREKMKVEHRADDCAKLRISGSVIELRAERRETTRFTISKRTEESVEFPAS